jgi:hypothetical protein
VLPGTPRAGGGCPVSTGCCKERPMSRWWSPLQETGNRWLEHKDARLGAALA